MPDPDYSFVCNCYSCRRKRHRSRPEKGKLVVDFENNQELEDKFLSYCKKDEDARS